MKTFQDIGYIHIMHFTGHQTVQGPKGSFSANCKLFKWLVIAKVYDYFNGPQCM